MKKKRLVISIVLTIALLGVAITGFVISCKDYPKSDGVAVMTVDKFLDIQKGESHE